MRARFALRLSVSVLALVAAGAAAAQDDAADKSGVFGLSEILVIGVLWLTSKLYGQPTQSEMRTETAHFYNLFYHVDLSAEQITALIGS